MKEPSKQNLKLLAEMIRLTDFSLIDDIPLNELNEFLWRFRPAFSGCNVEVRLSGNDYYCLSIRKSDNGRTKYA